MADWYGKNGVEEEFQEEDVWGGGVEKKDSSLQVKKFQKSQRRHTSSSGSTCSSAWSFNAAPKSNLPRAQETKVVPHHHHQQSSVPLNVPDWSKIYSGIKSNKSWFEHDGQKDGENIMHNRGIDDDDGDDDDEEMVPPHEFIARRMSRTQISSFSMFEGVGRTLKGRDLSKLRNAILTKTGFLE